MKNKILFSLLCILPMTANAAIPYRVEQINMPPEESVSGYDAEAFARDYRFYVGGMYTFSMWDNGADDAVSISGKNTSSSPTSFGAITTVPNSIPRTVSTKT